jgi:hypothetical protein
MVWGAIASVAGGLIGAGGSDDAAHAEQQAAENAAIAQRDQYNKTRNDLMPWMDSGNRALNVMNNAMFNGDYSQFYQSPDYQFRLDEGQRALDSSGAARGMALSGNQLKAITRYGGDMASGEYNNWFNKLNSMSSTGANTAGQIGGLGANAASNIGNAMMAGGNARASGYINKANSYNNAIAGLSEYAGSKGW